MSRNLRGRLSRLEKAIRPDKPSFSIWPIMDGTVRLEDWLADHGFADPLAALRAGVRGGLGILALDWWLHVRGYPEAWQAWEAGESGPAGLEHELVVQGPRPKPKSALRRIFFGWTLGFQMGTGTKSRRRATALIMSRRGGPFTPFPTAATPASPWAG